MGSRFTRDIPQSSFLKFDSIQDPRSRSIFASDIDHPLIMVASVYLIGFIIYFRASFLGGFFMVRQVIPRKIKVIKLPLESWGNISGYHGRLYQYGPTSTQGIIEWSAEFPSTEEDERCSEGFLERRLPRFSSVSPLMKRITRRIYEDTELITHQKQKNLNWVTVLIFLPVIVSAHKRAYDRFLC